MKNQIENEKYCSNAFNKLVKFNEEHGWKNPVYIIAKSNLLNGFFSVELDDFKDIKMNPDIEIFLINRSRDKFILGCCVKYSML